MPSQEGKYGFVCFSNSENAREALEALNDQTDSANGFTWYISKAMSKADRRMYLSKLYHDKQEQWKHRNILIKQIPKEFNDERIFKIFSQFGEIESIKVVKQSNWVLQDGQLVNEETPTGTAFICFKNEEHAKRALRQIPNLRLNDKPIIAKKWLPLAELKKRSSMNNQTAMSGLGQGPMPIGGLIGQRGRGMPQMRMPLP